MCTGDMVRRMRVRMEAWRVGVIKDCLVKRRRETEGHHVGRDRKERSPPLDWRPFSWKTQRHRELRDLRGNSTGFDQRLTAVVVQ